MANFDVPVAYSRIVAKKQRATPKSFPFAPVDQKAGKFYYGVNILTGSQPGAGTTDVGVYFSLTGSKRSSGRVSFKFPFDAVANVSSNDYMIVETDEDLGGVLVVELGNYKNILPFGADLWYVEKTGVFLFEDEKSFEFPCYHWIGDDDFVTTTAQTTTLKDVSETAVLVQQRRIQLAQQQERYQWEAFPNEKLPSAMKSSTQNLPPDEQFEQVKNINFSIEDPAEALIKLGLTSLAVDLNGLNDYMKFSNALASKEEKDDIRSLRWVSDVEFGRQILNGVNPIIIRKCTTLPTNFPVTDSMVNGLLNRQQSLQDEMKAGRVYICDLKIMDGLTTREGNYNVAPLLLLYVNGSNQLVPIAIQLQQQPGNSNPIFLPTDNWLDWMLAKMYYRLAHSQYHQLATHYLSCHAAMEVYSIATRRNLPDPHPIFKLLVPHFRYTMAINSRARDSLINEGGSIDRTFSIGGKGKVELLQRAGEQFSVHWTNIKRSIKERGVENPNLLPGYYYRDDNLRIWNALESYACGIVDLYYRSDMDVEQDKELQEWAKDIHDNGFPAHGGTQGHGFPNGITSKEELVEYCTLIMFTGSGQHSSINFGQFKEYSFIPNATFSMRQPPPLEKGKVDLQRVLDSLPNELTAIITILIVNQLSKYSDDEVFLSEFPTQRFTEETAISATKKFQDELEQTSEDIKKRNKTLDVPYTFCLPERITKSITI